MQCGPHTDSKPCLGSAVAHRGIQGRLVERAQMSRAPIQAIADRISAVFVPAVLVAALLTWLGWFAAGGGWL